MTRLRIAVVAHSGSGKSTCAGLIEQFAADAGLTHRRVKLATPLYDLQRAVYRRAGVEPGAETQDQILMEALADAMRRINPASLAEDFTARLAAGPTADVVVNDDLRDPEIDAVVLREHGFRVLRVTCAEEVRLKRLAERGDPTRADRSTRDIDLIAPDAVVDNSGSLSACRTAVTELLRSWL